MAESNLWVQALPLEVLKTEGRRVLKIADKKLAFFWHEQEIFACDNRCPHEGFPLSEGGLSAGKLPVLQNGSSAKTDERHETVKTMDCLITCNWHNWKFSLRDGSNLFGGDELRVYPTKLLHADVWVDIAEPAIETQQAKACSLLTTALQYNDYPLITRELIRASQVGVSLEQSLLLAVQQLHERLAFGTSHGLVSIVDWLQLRAERNCPAEKLVCLVEPLAHMASDGLRHLDYPYNDKLFAGSLEQLASAIEAEDEATATGILRYALRKETSLASLEHCLSRSALAHYGDLGHSLIFVNKTFQVIEALGSESALPLLLPLVRTLVFATREENLPAFDKYSWALQAYGAPGSQTPTTPSFSAVPNAVLNATSGAKLGAKSGVQSYARLGTNAALLQTVARREQEPQSIWADLYATACERLYHFDVRTTERTDGPVSDNISWLNVTHGITFASAVQETCNRYPDLWGPGLLQLSCMVGRTVGYRDPRVLEPKPLKAETVFGECLDRLMDHGEVEHVVSVHLLKTTLAARKLWAEGFRPPLLLAGLKRYFDEPMKRRHTLRTSKQSLALTGPFKE